MKMKYPKTYLYLDKFREILENRSGYRLLRKGHPFYILVDIHNETFSQYKVVWKYISEDFTCCVISDHKNNVTKNQLIIPDHRLMLIPSREMKEAHYLAGMLNSSISQYIVKVYAVGTQTSTHVLENIRIPKFNPENNLHLKLSELSQKAHEETAKGNDVSEIEEEIDLLTAKIWGLTDDELKDIKKSLEELR